MKFRKAALLTVAALLLMCFFPLLLSQSPCIFPFPRGVSEASASFKSSPFLDPVVYMSAYWINHTWTLTTRNTTLVLEENLTGDSFLIINCTSSLNQSVAMSFNITYLGDVKVNFTGVALYLWKNGTDPLDLFVQLRNATEVGGSPVPNETIIEKFYSNVPTSPGWSVFLNETPVTLNVSNTYAGCFFIVVYTNTTSDTTYFVWNATADDDVDSGFTSINNFASLEDLNDTFKWDSSDEYDCWMNVSLTVYDVVVFELPTGWDLDYLFVDVGNDTVLGSVSGTLTNQNGSFTVSVPGDRVYSGNFSFYNVVPGAKWLVFEDRMNSGGYARCSGGMGEAQMFLLMRDANGVNVSVPVANFGADADLVGELRNATLVDGRWVPGSIVEVVKVSSSSIPSTYSWITFNFTSSLSSGTYFLVLHMDGWRSSSGGYYDWGSHMESGDEAPPNGGYEIWTFDNGSSWVEDVRDPYGNRYWHCMKLAPNYVSWSLISDLLLSANGLLVRNDGSWNSSLWLSPKNNVSVVVEPLPLTYNVNYTFYYVNYTGNLSSYKLYLNGTQVTSTIGGGYTATYTGTAIGYNKSEGRVSFTVGLKNENNEWVEENLTIFAFAKLTFTFETVAINDAKITCSYTHNGPSVFPEQHFITVYYPSDYAVKIITVNDASEENYFDIALNETTRRLTILKNIPSLSNGDPLTLNVALLPELNVTHGFAYINEELQITIGNLLDNPSRVNVTVIFPNGSNQVFSTTPSGSSCFITFTPDSIGKYILKATSQDGSISYDRNFTSGRAYVFYVQRLAAFFVKPQQNEELTVGQTYTIMIWVNYTPLSGATSFSGNVSLKVNGSPIELRLDWETGLYVAEFTPRSLGSLNLTVEVTDDSGHTATTTISVNVTAPEGLKPSVLLASIFTSATIKYWEITQLNNVLSPSLLLITIFLVAIIYLKPEIINRLLDMLRKIRKLGSNIQAI